MWALGVLAPSREEPICIPSSPVSSPCDDTCLDETDDAMEDEDDDVVMMPSQSRRTYVTTGRSRCRATCQGPLELRPRLNPQTPKRPPHEPWYMACHDFPLSPSLRPAEVHAFNLLLKSSPPRKADILLLTHYCTRSACCQWGLT